MRAPTAAGGSTRGMSMLLLAALVAAGGCTRDGTAGVTSLSTLASEALNPTLALGPGGSGGETGFAAWIETDADGVSDVFLAPLDGNTPAVRVNHLPGDASPHDQAPPQVAVGTDGTVYVVWQTGYPVPGRRYPASNLRLARSTDGGLTFHPAVFVNEDAGGPPTSHSFHDLAVTPDGTVLVSWIDGRARDRERTARGASQPASGGHGGHGGHAHEGDPLPRSEVRIARSRDGGASFEASVVVDGDVCPCCRTSLAVGRDGSLYLAWRREADGDVRDVVMARAEPGTVRFGAAVPLHEDGWVFPACPHAGPNLAVGEDGSVHAVWYTGREGRQGLWYASSGDLGQTFSTPAAIVTGEWVPPSLARLAFAGDRLIIAWEDRRTEHHLVRVSEVIGGVPRDTGIRLAGRLPSLAGHASGWEMVWWDAGEVRRAGG